MDHRRSHGGQNRTDKAATSTQLNSTQPKKGNNDGRPGEEEEAATDDGGEERTAAEARMRPSMAIEDSHGQKYARESCTYSCRMPFQETDSVQISRRP